MQPQSIRWISGETMPICIWIPITPLSPRCDALPVLHVKRNGKAVITCFDYFVFSYNLFIRDPGCGAAIALALKWSRMASAFVFDLIEPPSAHPLIGNDRINLNM